MLLSQRFLQLIAAFALTLLSLLIWYFMTNPPPPIPLKPATETVESTTQLWTDLTAQLAELGIKEQISKELPLERLKKLEIELAGIISKTASRQFCEQYALVVLKDGLYPCYNCGVETMIYLKKGEIWKYGKTCIGEEKRYGNLEEQGFLFTTQFQGSEIDCLIIEKIKIYNYLVHPQNISRAMANGQAPLLRPPGNKIDR